MQGSKSAGFAVAIVPNRDIKGKEKYPDCAATGFREY